MTPLVTIGIPVYKRLGYLPGVLRTVAAQTYPAIDLLVSDNGENDGAVDALVAEHYHRPYRMRRNGRSVSIVEHFNQLAFGAQGPYFTLLSDDDEISPTYVADLVALLEATPRANVAISRVETFSEDGSRVLASTDDLAPPPEVMTGMELLRRWSSNQHKFLCFTTNLSRTAAVHALGGYPDFERANGSDNALLIKLALGHEVCYSPHCTFRHRIHEASYGKTASTDSLAVASRQFLTFLEHDLVMAQLRHDDPATWAEASELVREVVYRTYLGRWRKLYRDRIGGVAWVRAGFALPLHPRYTRQVVAELLYSLPGLGDLARRRRQASRGL